jgi:tetratricopeptide (TPR) repeat protein
MAGQPPSDFPGAVALHRAGRLAEAIAIYRDLLDRDPGNHGIRLNLGAALAAAGDAAGAAAAYRTILDSAPDHPGALYNHGNLRRNEGAHAEALDLYRRCVAARPDDVRALTALGQQLTDAGSFGEARAVLARALRLAPDDARIWNALGIALWRSGLAESAVAHYGRAHRLDPSFAGVLTNLGIALRHLGRQSEALACHREATRRLPDSPMAWTNLGVTLVADNLLDAGIDAYERSLALAPGNAEASFNRGVARLLKGDFKGGFEDYEARWRRPDVRPLPLGAPLWDGGDIAGKRLLLFAEQGYGDTIQCARFAAPLAAAGASVILHVQPELVRLLTGMPGVSAVMSRDTAPPPHDLRAPLLGLPHLLGTTEATIPSPEGYLPALPSRRSQDRRLDRLRVGIVWAGSPTHLNDRNRSCRLTDMLELAANPRIDLVSLQKGEAAAELGRGEAALVEDAGSACRDFADTARVLSGLDLLISVDTSVAHLAGAMGIRVWTMLPFAPDWRWMLERDTSPWYRTMRLFRRKRADSGFGPVIGAIGRELAVLADQPPGGS